MPLNEWSDDILIAELNEEPAFSEEMAQLLKRIEDRSRDLPDVIVDMKEVSYLNSSNIAQLLKLRQQLQNANRTLKICCVQEQVRSMLNVTGLDKVFTFNDSVAMSLAALQIADE